MQIIEAVFENGVLRPVQPLDLEEGECVMLTLKQRKRAIDEAKSILSIAQETDLPADYAINIDHYLYGLPKQNEIKRDE